ncbi:hypothetical protein F66182_12072 [Fusarium sp. NRRL 66182]|nr:hypothetical protein F66182_12072 [Fusarium sp. NRRL 66182]
MAQPSYSKSPSPPRIGSSIDRLLVGAVSRMSPFKTRGDTIDSPQHNRPLLDSEIRQYNMDNAAADLRLPTISNSRDALDLLTEAAARQSEALDRQRLDNRQSNLQDTPISQSADQHTTSLAGTISTESPFVERGVNSSVDRNAQSGVHRYTSTFEAYTDSGYASNTTRALKPSEVPGQVHQTEEISVHHGEIESRSISSLDGNVQLMEQEDDVASIYSDSSTIPTLTRARYIDGLADDLAQAIQPYHLNDEVLRQIIEKLPELLKAFALTFGHHESGTMHRDVMVFIHKYRRYVLR